jgi:hypothetical protein
MAEIADQRSSKSAAGALFGSLRAFLMPSIQGEGDRTVMAVAATASTATARNPVIVRGFVIRTSRLPEPSLHMGHGNFAKVQNEKAVH